MFAQINLGSMHSEGLPKDHVLAYIWGYLVVSRAQDDATREVANKTRDNLVQRMSPEKIGVARGWKPAN